MSIRAVAIMVVSKAESKRDRQSLRGSVGFSTVYFNKGIDLLQCNSCPQPPPVKLRKSNYAL
jgi:hypothetical protein